MSDILCSLKTHQNLGNAYLFFGEDESHLQSSTLSLVTSLMNHATNTNIAPSESLSLMSQLPDFIYHLPNTSIKIETIRAIQEQIKYGPSHSPLMIIVLDRCHLLTKEAANALLKTIEEPPQNVHFIFTTTAKETVLPTILSRCNLLYLSSATPISKPDPYIDFFEIKSLPLHEQSTALTPYFKDKKLLQQLLYSWIETIWSTQPPHTALSMVTPIINCLKRLEYHVNNRLQLESLMVQYTL